MDLFTPTVPEDEQHQNFRMLAQPGFCEPEIAVINDWAKGFVDRDGKFVKEFQTTFNSSFWELYLFACFKALNCKVDFKYAAPDFTVESAYGAFVAEATTANNPEGFRPEWERDISPEALEKIDLEEIVRLSTIRLANAITKKYRKYLSSYANLTHVQGKPFLICIAPFEQPFFFLQGDLALVRTLYAYDRPLLIPREKELLMVGESRNYRVQKHSGAEIPLGVFTNPGMADVSAVLFSSTATFGKVRALAGEGKYPIIFRAMRAHRSENIEGVNWIVAQRPDYQETVLDGLHVCLNPFAKIPLDLRLFAHRELTIHNYDPHTESYGSKVPDGFLYTALPGVMRYNNSN